MNTLKQRMIKYTPDRFKPTLRANYRNAKLTWERIKRRLHPPPLPKNKNGKVYIHLGCGEVNAPGFINVDAIPFSHVHYVQEVNDLTIFPNEYGDLIYACHVLEHISQGEVPKVLKEWKRVLKIGGVLRLSVPDFDKLVDVYLTESKNVEAIIEPLIGGYEDYPYNLHKSIFNHEYLTKLLQSLGFKEVREWEPEKVELQSFEDYASMPIKFKRKKYPISLNIEATKSLLNKNERVPNGQNKS